MLDLAGEFGSQSLLVPLVSQPAPSAPLLRAVTATPTGIADGLVGHWSATLTQSWSDITGNSNMTPTGSPSIIPEATAYNGTHAYSFPIGATRYSWSNHPAVDWDGALSVSCWINDPMSWSGTFGMGFLMGPAPTNTSIASAAVMGVTKYLTGIGVSGADYLTAADNFAPADPDTWYHVVMVQDGASGFGGTIRLYLNGQLTSADHVRTQASNSTYFYLNRGVDNGADGKMLDSVRLYDRVLSGSEISELFNGGRNEDFVPPPGQDIDLTAVAGSTHSSGQAPTLEVSAPVDLTVPAGATHSAGQSPTLQIGKNVDLTAAVGTTDTIGQAPSLQIGANVDITVQAGQSVSQGRTPQLEIGGNVQITVPSGLTQTEGQIPILQIQENVDLVAVAGQSVTVGQIPSLIAGGGISMAAMAVSTQVIQAQIDA